VKQITAEEAIRIGIVSEVVPHEKLMERATELATMISEAAHMHVRCHKEFLRRLVEALGSFGQRLVDIIMRPLYYSGDTIEGKGPS
jgi:enoyl-CoA hydratase/carnithine racemase